MSFGFGFGFPRRAAAGGAAPSLNFDFTSLTSLPSRITFSRTSNAMLTNSNGRVAYAPHNLLTNSEDFEASWVRSSSTVTANVVVAEDGTTTGDTVVSAAATAITGVYKVATITAGINTQSIYVKQATGVRYVQLLWTSGGLSNEWANFDLQTGTLTGGSYTQAVITPARNGWYRLAMTSTTTASVTDGPWIIAVTSGSAGRGATYPGNGTDSFSVWGAQLNVANAPVNLLTFSEQFDNAVWQKLAAGTAVAPVVTANYATAPDGTLTADRIVFDRGTGTTGSDISYINQSITSVPSDCTGSIWLRTTDGSTKSISFRVGNTFNYTANVTGTWTRFTLTGTAPITRVDLLAYGNASVQVTDLLVWGAQLNTGFTALPYVATTSSIYLPPSYNSTTPKNLLGFTQEFDNAAWTKSNSFVQTNLVLYSEQFDVTVNGWTKVDATITANATDAPDGYATADLFVALAGTGTSPRILTTNNVAGAIAPHVASFFVKNNTNNFIQIANSAGTAWHCNFDVSAGLVGTSNNCTGTINNIGSGWYRCSVAYTPTNTADVSARCYLVPSSSASRAQTWNPLGTESVYIWGAQLVQGSVPGDYQVTTSAAAAVQYSDPNGTRTADKLVENTAAGVAHRVQQTINITSAAITLTAYLQAGERTWGHLRLDDAASTKFAYFDLATGQLGSVTSGATSSISSVGSGWYRCSITLTAPAATASGVVVIGPTTGNNVNTYTGDGTSGIYIWGAQLSNSASVDPYVYNPQAAPTSTAYYGPRFDYNPTTLAANGLLIEQQSTNLFLNSSSLSGVSFSNGTRAADQLVAPDGTVTGSVISGTGGGVATWTTNATATGTSMTFTVYVKVGLSSTRNTFTFLMRNDTTGTNFVAGSFSTLTGAISGLGWTSTNVGNDWYRIAYTNSGSEIISVGNSITCYFGATGGIVFATTDRLGLWGAQLEAGSFATSYIPTVASQVTRAADNASMLGDNFSTWFNATEGTISSEASCFGLRAAGNGVVGISDGTTSNRFGTYVLSTNNAVVNYMLTGGVLQAEFVVNSAAANSSVFTSAFGYKANDFAASVNGGAALTDTSGSIATVNRLLIGNIYDVAATNWLNGWVRSISYYPTRLPNATLVSITA